MTARVEGAQDVTEPVGEIIEAADADFGDMRIRFIKLSPWAKVKDGELLYARPVSAIAPAAVIGEERILTEREILGIASAAYAEGLGEGGPRLVHFVRCIKAALATKEK